MFSVPILAHEGFYIARCRPCPEAWNLRPQRVAGPKIGEETESQASSCHNVNPGKQLAPQEKMRWMRWMRVKWVAQWVSVCATLEPTEDQFSQYVPGPSCNHPGLLWSPWPRRASRRGPAPPAAAQRCGRRRRP